MKSKFHSVLKRHAHMVFDLERSIPLLKAIQKKVRAGDVVVDVGCGIGLLSFAAAQAGAKRVYAIDVDAEALDFAKWQAKKLGMEKKICWIEDHSFNVDLMEKADLLIQETVGALAFDENFLPTLCDAKKRFLKRGGKIIPEELSLAGAPVDSAKKFLAPPTVLKKIDTRTTKQLGIWIKKTWVPPKGVRRLWGVLVWPHIVWAKGCITDGAPMKKPTHWRQTLLPLTPRARQTMSLRWKFSLEIKPHPQNPLYNTEIAWQIAPTL